MKSNLKNRTKQQSGFIPTLNNMGYMVSSLDAYSQEFVNFASTCKGTVVDIGAAYGIATLEVLKSGSCHIIANDIAQGHLDCIMEQAQEHKKRLTLLRGAFPHEVQLEDNSIDAVLISRLLHFFPGSLIEKSLEQIMQWLVPGGKLFLVADTPYINNFINFLPIFEKRKKNQQAWPGEVTNISEYSHSRSKDLPSFMNVLDQDTLVRALEKAGYQIEAASEFAQPNFPLDSQLDGREGVGVIAVKP